MSARSVLETRRVSMSFGGLRALSSVDLDIRPKEIVALIGPNGAGKTTFFNCLTGIYTPTEGEIVIRPAGGGERRIDGLAPHQVTNLGLARTFQNIRLFQNMTVIENVMVARHCRTKSSVLGALVRGPLVRREEEGIIEASFRLLEQVGLGSQAKELAKNLSYGAQRRLEIARALATEPFLLLLDEPAAGMNPQETEELNGLITRIRREHDLSILLIEHDMRLVMSLSDRIFVLEYGSLISQGTPDEIAADARVIKAYLGEESDG